MWHIDAGSGATAGLHHCIDQGVVGEPVAPRSADDAQIRGIGLFHARSRPARGQRCQASVPCPSPCRNRSSPVRRDAARGGGSAMRLHACAGGGRGRAPPLQPGVWRLTLAVAHSLRLAGQASPCACTTPRAGVRQGQILYPDRRTHGVLLRIFGSSPSLPTSSGCLPTSSSRMTPDCSWPIARGGAGFVTATASPPCTLPTIAWPP